MSVYTPDREIMLDLREAELNRRDSALRRQTLELAQSFAESERKLVEERERLRAAITELHQRLRRTEMVNLQLSASKQPLRLASEGR
jgi:hypothetical protein